MEKHLLKSLENGALAPAMSNEIENAMAETVISPLAQMIVFPRSITAVNHCLYFLGRRDTKRYVGIITETASQAPALGEPRSIHIKNTALYLTLTEADTKASDVIQEGLSFLKPRVIGPTPSVGCGDRLGLATPGHVRALAKTELAAVLCQQSVRENTRTGRSPRQVLDDAVWGAWQSGWRRGFGADADHLKTTDEIEAFVNAGYTFLPSIPEIIWIPGLIMRVQSNWKKKWPPCRGKYCKRRPKI